MRLKARAVATRTKRRQEELTAAAVGLTLFERREVIRRRHRIRAAGFGARSSTAELAELAQAAAVPVVKLPPGTHAGWRPSWMQWTG